MKTSILLAPALLVTCLSAEAAIINLTGTVRDFQESHPDFERFSDGHVVTGMVQTTLGVDGKPVYSGLDVDSVYNRGEYFNQWYHDVEGVNERFSHTISLDNTITSDPNVYTFRDTDFFPIDNLGFGNENHAHNYHFTFELSTNFTYQGGETFSFTGDDDLWVYINNQLVVDLGGVHNAATGSVNLDTLGLTVGNNYSFDLFFAERHTTASSFSIDTSILLGHTTVPEPDSLALIVLGLVGFSLARLKKSANNALVQ